MQIKEKLCFSTIQMAKIKKFNNTDSKEDKSYPNI